jgi:two-component system sensor histidine kinase TctE
MGNLVDNALRYTPCGGVVTARVRSGRSWIDIDVEDSGPGIPASERAMVFERFYRVLGTQVDGSGLGLAIVREIASQHDARIDIEDMRPGADPPGARFVIRFPKHRESGW